MAINGVALSDTVNYLFPQASSVETLGLKKQKSQF